MPWKYYGVLTRNTLLRRGNASVRSTLVFHTSQAVRLKLMGHCLNFQPMFIGYSMDSFHPGQKKKKLVGGGGEEQRLKKKKSTFFTELILPIDFCFIDGLGKMTNLSWSALSHSQPLAILENPLHPWS